MMTAEVARSVVDSMKSTPFLLGLMVINIIVLIGFAFTLREVGKGIERRDVIIKDCVEHRRPS